MSNEENKNKKTASEFFHKVGDVSKKAANEVSKNAKAFYEKSKVDNYNRRMKKYNPLFPDEYNGLNFNIPNMIVIVDDAVRRDIDVCEGAMGWRQKENGVEILYLYDEYIKESGITFIPVASCDSIYYVDHYNKKNFIRTDCIFSKAHEEKLAELEHIAYSLGAKSCSVEIVETETETEARKMNINQKAEILLVSAEESHSVESDKKTSNLRSGKTRTDFEGSNEPRRPRLKWFAQDNNIKGLIEMRCSNKNQVRSRKIVLEGASSATMSQKTASSIDLAIKKIGGQTEYNMERQAKKEFNSKLIFEVEF